MFFFLFLSVLIFSYRYFIQIFIADEKIRQNLHLAVRERIFKHNALFRDLQIKHQAVPKITFAVCKTTANLYYTQK